MISLCLEGYFEASGPVLREIRLSEEINKSIYCEWQIMEKDCARIIPAFFYPLPPLLDGPFLSEAIRLCSNWLMWVDNSCRRENRKSGFSCHPGESQENRLPVRRRKLSLPFSVHPL
jgi:hypothetical protein